MRKLLVFALLAMAVSINADVDENLEYTYYVANADPSISLLSILNAASPVRKNGRVFHAYTTWNVKWDFRWFEQPDGSCKITGVSSKLTGNIQLPRLFGASSSQKNQFDTYLSALRVHELGHYNIGRKAAEVIDQRILSLPGKPNCKSLATTANDLANQVLSEYTEKGIQYDISTDYGRSQGAWLIR